MSHDPSDLYLTAVGVSAIYCWILLILYNVFVDLAGQRKATKVPTPWYHFWDSRSGLLGAVLAVVVIFGVFAIGYIPLLAST